MEIDEERVAYTIQSVKLTALPNRPDIVGGRLRPCGAEPFDAIEIEVGTIFGDDPSR